MSVAGASDWVDRREVDGIVRLFRRATSLRDDRLLAEFMPRAYRAITLSSVGCDRVESVIFAKVTLGAMITLLDDLADRPDQQAPRVLREAAFVPAEPERIDWGVCPPERRGWLEVVMELGAVLSRAVRRLPHGERLWPWLIYDVGRCHLSMAYASLAGRTPGAVSASALAETQHQNMTISLAGVVDLMASDGVDWGELGAMRAVFDEAQRAARISNVLTTYERELAEGDVTNELAARVAAGEPRADAEAALEAERQARVARVRAARVSTFDVMAYADGIEAVDRLHREMQAVI